MRSEPAQPVGLSIRHATVADARTVALTHVASWRSGYVGQLPDEFLAGLSVETRTGSWARALSGETRADSVTLVAVVDDRVVGFASVGPSRDEGVASNTGELWGLYTHPDSWGSGVGTALHSAALRELGASGFSCATLWVLTSNDRARRFYERRGWRPDGQTKTDWRGDVRLDESRYRLNAVR